MKKLRLLDVQRNYYHCGQQRVKVPKFLSNELRWISWKGYPARSLPTNFQPTKLGGLIMVGGLQEQLWKGYKHLPSLKVLDLSDSENLIRTPDFGGLPYLERLTLAGCTTLKEIHPSIGYLERLVLLNLGHCYKLEMIPPIVRMKKVETLILSGCFRLRKFPKIQTNMDSLLKLCLLHTGIEVVPSSIGQYCTNLVSINLSSCHRVKSIEGNFRLLKHLKVLDLTDCRKFEKLPQDLFEVECGLEELSLPPKRQSPSSQNLIRKTFKNLMNSSRLQFIYRDLVALEFPCFPHFLRKLNLNGCNLVDGDILFDTSELSNLQVLDLSGNKFSRLHSSLSQLPRLKLLDVSYCESLVELPELPSSIAILKANGCDKLEIVGDFPTNYTWLWKVSLKMKCPPELGENKQYVIGGDKILQSMLQENATENSFLSLCLPGHEIPRGFVPSLVKGKTFTLQLPHNWYNDFSGFLICIAAMAPPLLSLSNYGNYEARDGYFDGHGFSI